MPAPNFCSKLNRYFENEDEKKEFKKVRNARYMNRFNWSKRYGYKVKDNEYEQFHQIIKIVKKIHKIHDFIVNHYTNKIYSKHEDLEILTMNYKNIKDIEPYIAFIKSLERTK